jgi:hypothetical protein
MKAPAMTSLGDRDGYWTNQTQKLKGTYRIREEAHGGGRNWTDLGSPVQALEYFNHRLILRGDLYTLLFVSRHLHLQLTENPSLPPAQYTPPRSLRFLYNKTLLSVSVT